MSKFHDRARPHVDAALKPAAELRIKTTDGERLKRRGMEALADWFAASGS